MMKIGELSIRTSVSTDTLRFYEKRGLIHSERRANGYRDFDQSMIRQVGLLRLGQKLGFSLNEMQKIVVAITSDTMGIDETAALLRGKLTDIDTKIQEMNQMKALLSETLEQVCPLRK